VTAFAQVGADHVRARLERLKAQIEAVGHGATLSLWAGDKAAERQVQDDLSGGRLAWETAWRNCCHGLDALDSGDADLALCHLLEAQAMAINALGMRLSRVRSEEGLKLLAKPAKPRGRRKKLIT
jgi:hypothetical protein